MLKPYNLSNPINYFQNLLDYIFNKIWMKATAEKTWYHFISENPFLVDYYSNNKAKTEGYQYDFINLIDQIYDDFLYLTDEQKTLLNSYYVISSDVEKLCNSIELIPLKYDRIEDILSLSDTYKYTHKLKNNLQKFYLFCWENKHKTEFVSLNLSLDKIQAKFKSANPYISECPICGIQSIYQDFNNSVDHYLTKSNYAFLSVNEKNLVPMCSDCNSKFKTVSDVLYDGTLRKKAFYPYGIYDSEINVIINKVEYDNGTIKEVDITIKSNKYPEEAEQWQRVFRILDRYVDFLKTHVKVFLQEMIDNKIIDNNTEISERINCRKLMYSSQKFLRLAYYEYWLNTDLTSHQSAKVLMDLQQ